jgi:hypothetical protein
MAEDCGPCSQLAVTMAERQGVAPAVIKAIVAGDEHAMTPDAALAYRFAQAVLRHDPGADALREQIVARWGRRALVSLAWAAQARPGNRAAQADLPLNWGITYWPNSSIDFMMCSCLSPPTCMMHRTWSAPAFS